MLNVSPALLSAGQGPAWLNAGILAKASRVLWSFATYKPKPGAPSTMGQGRRGAGCGMKLPAPAPRARPPSSTRREMSLSICLGGGLSAIEVSSAGRSDGEEDLP